MTPFCFAIGLGVLLAIGLCRWFAMLAALDTQSSSMPQAEDVQ